MLPGIVVDNKTIIPPILENTKIIDAGSLRLGVEFRLLTENTATDQFGADFFDNVPEHLRGMIKPRDEDDSGVSVHVFGDDGLEYLRFDCFGVDPHYHYLKPHGTEQRVVLIDTIALGEPLAWTLNCLRTQLEPMLDESGATDCLDRLDRKLLAKALDQVEHIALSLAPSLAAAQ